MLRLRLDRIKKSRRELFDALRREGIGVHVHYIPLHLLRNYRQMGHQRGDFPVAEAYYDSAMTLPLFPAMSDDEVQRVIDTVQKAVTAHAK
jgi:dTDP-4-amino-4,6-dideoxygalactose transaminase